MTRSAVLAATVATAVFSACTATNWRRTAPHNFPPLHEWNAPFETSWINAVDTYRALTAPHGTVYDPLMRNYQPDLSTTVP